MDKKKALAITSVVVASAMAIATTFGYGPLATEIYNAVCGPTP